MGTVPLRCDKQLYGLLTDGRWLEVKCKRRACGYEKGIVLLHTIDIQTGEVVLTKKFRDPRYTQKEGLNASHNPLASVRSKGREAQAR